MKYISENISNWRMSYRMKMLKMKILGSKVNVEYILAVEKKVTF